MDENLAGWSHSKTDSLQKRHGPAWASPEEATKVIRGLENLPHKGGQKLDVLVESSEEQR